MKTRARTMAERRFSVEREPVRVGSRSLTSRPTTTLGTVDWRSPSTPSVAHYLPHALVASVLVLVMPSVVVAFVMPSGSVLATIGAMVTAVLLSLAVARVGAAAWMRRPGSRDVVFGDLMAWGWVRRMRAERQLVRARRDFLRAQASGVPLELPDLERMGRILEARDTYTHGHSQRVAQHAERIAGKLGLSRAEVATVRSAALLHDIGKLATPRDVLNKPGRLDDDEYAIIKRHPIDGAAMLEGVADPELVTMVRHHHERLDGHGYPAGLCGGQIPLGARIIAVADTFDALTSARPYRAPATHRRAIAILSKEAGTQLDAAAVAAVLDLYTARRSVLWTAVAAAMPQRLALWAGQTFGGGVAQVLPAAAAAAVLGLSPSVGMHHGPAAPPVSEATRAVPAIGVTDAATGVGDVGTAERQRDDGTAPTTPRRPDGNGVAGTGEKGDASGSGSAEAGADSTATSASIASTSGADGGSSSSGPDVGSQPGPRVLATPGVTTPTATVPSATTPSVSAPSVTTPAVTAPTVTAPTVTAPTVTAPSVTVPSITTPSIGVGAVTVPSIAVG